MRANGSTDEEMAKAVKTVGLMRSAQYAYTLISWQDFKLRPLRIEDVPVNDVQDGGLYNRYVTCIDESVYIPCSHTH